MLLRIMRRNVGAGLLLAGFGGAGLILGADLPLGTARRMSAGYMPYGLSWLLLGFGALIALRGLLGPEDPIIRVRLRPFLGVLGGGILFALLIETAGIVLAAAGAIMAAALGDRSSRWTEVILLAGLAMAFCTFVFGYLLGVRMPIWFP